MKIDERVNHLPVLTWNRLKLNDVSLIADVDFDKESACNAVIPDGVTVEEFTFEELEKKFEELSLDNPKEKFVAGKVPMYNAQRFGTGMGEGVDNIIKNAGIKVKVYTVEKDIEEPILMDFLYKEGAAGFEASFIHLKKGVKASFVMKYSSEGNAAGFVGNSTRVYLEEGSELKLTKVQLLPAEYTFLDDIGGISDASSSFSLIKIDLGALNVYEGLSEIQRGDKSDFKVDYSYLGLPESFLDINYNDIFIGKKCNGVMRFSEALLGNAKKTFRGTVDFRQYSTASVGDEEENVLLLGEDVVNKTIPLILCEEEDVEGRHAATVGSLSPDMLFYLATRGIDEEQAKKIIIKASIRRVANLIEQDEIRQAVEERISSLFE